MSFTTTTQVISVDESEYQTVLSEFLIENNDKQSAECEMEIDEFRSKSPSPSFGLVDPDSGSSVVRSVSPSSSSDKTEGSTVDIEESLRFKIVTQDIANINITTAGDSEEGKAGEERPFQCSKAGCPQTFRSKREVWVHESAVHRKKIRCPACLKLLKKKTRPKHFKICKKGINFNSNGLKCPHFGCSTYFKCYDTLSSHILEQHQEELTIDDRRYLDLKNTFEEVDKLNQRKKNISQRLKTNTQKPKEVKKVGRLNKKPRLDNPLHPPPPPPPLTNSYSYEIEVHPPIILQNEKKSILEQAKSTSFLDEKSTISFLPKICKSDKMNPATVISLNPILPMPNFPSFTRFMYRSGLAELGAILVIPPIYNTESASNVLINQLMSTTCIPKLEKMSVQEKGASGKSFKILTEIHEKPNKKYSIRSFKNAKNPKRPCNLSGKDMDDMVFGNLCNGNILYGSHTPGTFFKSSDRRWNLNSLDNDFQNGDMYSYLNDERKRVLYEAKGITSPYLYVGKWASLFLLHKEDEDMGSVSYLHFGDPKIWFVIPPRYARALEEKMAREFPEDSKKCNGFLRHKSHIITPSLLDDWDIPYNRIEHKVGEYVVLPAESYHFGYNSGFNIAEAVNYHTFDIYPYFLSVYYDCYCPKTQNYLPRDMLVEAYEKQTGNYELYMKGKYKVPVPHAPELGLVDVLNDNDRSKKWLQMHQIQRVKNNGINPYTGENYKDEQSVIECEEEIGNQSKQSKPSSFKPVKKKRNYLTWRRKRKP